MKRLGLLLLMTLAATTAAAQNGYDEAALKAFRAEREKILLADNGWFTVAGLHFLNPGENKFGSDPLNDIVLEFADVPKQAGVITMDGKNVTIKSADGTTLTYNGQPVKDAPLRLAENKRPADLITFKSTAVEPSRNDWKLTGDLTIRGITRPVTFDLVFEGGTSDPYGNVKAGFTITGEIDRKDWGLTWNVPLESGGVLVSEKFRIEFDVEAGLQT